MSHGALYKVPLEEFQLGKPLEEQGCGVRQEDEALVVVDRHSRHSLKAAAAFLLPALCDSLATTLLNLGLYYTCEVLPSSACPCVRDCLQGCRFCAENADSESSKCA